MRPRLALAVVAVLVVACSDDPRQATPGGDGRRATTTTLAGPDRTADLGAEPTIEVLDAGAEPRQELRYAFEAGDRVVIEQATTLDQELSGTRTGPVTTATTMSATVTAVDGGIATIEMTYEDVQVTAGPEVDPAVVDGTEQGAVALEGATATIRVDDRGGMDAFDLRMPPDAPAGIDSVIDSLAATIRQQAVAFPEEPIGVGGSWLVRYEVDVLGVQTTIDQTFTVAARRDDAVDLGVVTTGTFNRVGEGSSEGSGTMRVPFDSLLPDAALVARNVLAVQGTELVQDLTINVARRP